MGYFPQRFHTHVHILNNNRVRVLCAIPKSRRFASPIKELAPQQLFCGCAPDMDDCAKKTERDDRRSSKVIGKYYYYSTRYGHTKPRARPTHEVEFSYKRFFFFSIFKSRPRCPLYLGNRKV